MAKSITVFLEEECGYRYWIWRPGMGTLQLIRWWYMTPNIPLDPQKLPGEVIPFAESKFSEKRARRSKLRGTMPYAHLHIPEDSYLRVGGVTYPYINAFRNSLCTPVA